jgi:hypothetical protein
MAPEKIIYHLSSPSLSYLLFYLIKKASGLMLRRGALTLPEKRERLLILLGMQPEARVRCPRCITHRFLIFLQNYFPE